MSHKGFLCHDLGRFIHKTLIIRPIFIFFLTGAILIDTIPIDLLGFSSSGFSFSAWMPPRGGESGAFSAV